MLFGLPDTRDLQANPRPERVELNLHQSGIQAIEQPLRDVLLLAQDGTPGRLRRMRGEHGSMLIEPISAKVWSKV